MDQNTVVLMLLTKDPVTKPEDDLCSQAYLSQKIDLQFFLSQQFADDK